MQRNVIKILLVLLKKNWYSETNIPSKRIENINCKSKNTIFYLKIILEKNSKAVSVIIIISFL